MIIYILLLIMTTAAAFLVHKPETLPAYGMTRQQFLNRICLCGIFLMLFAVSACRYQVGCDYATYEEYYYRIWYGFIVPTEKGFNLLIKVLEHLFGKDSYLLFFAFFAFFTVYFMLKALYALSEKFVFSFYLFMAFSYYYQSLNTMRYYFAMALALYAVTYIHKKQYAKFILIVLLASAVHKSVLLVIPLYLLANCTWRRWQIILLSLLAVSGLVFGDVYLKIILYLYPSYNNTSYLAGGTSYINIIRCLLVLLFCLAFDQEGWRERPGLKMYFRLNNGALMLYVCGSFIPEVSRVGTYMTIMQVFLLPGVVNSIRDEKKQKIVKAGVILFAAVYFAAFLYKAYGERVQLLPYHTWLF